LKKKKSLHIQEGKDSPGSINKAALSNVKKFRKKRLSPIAYKEGILEGKINILSEAITLIESNNAKHKDLAREIIELCLPHSGNSIRIGITGIPGVGKSTFIESFGSFLCSKLNKKVAVLAIDPSSEKSQGSILGDKTRMENLSIQKNAFIRPSPSAHSLGGVARKTRESIILCEAAGYDIILVETVGVGQSETAVHSMVDYFLLLMLAGAGDELQGIKRGIMEMADGLALTKADGDNINRCEKAKIDLKHALHMLPRKENHWLPRVYLTSSLEKKGIEMVWEDIQKFENHTKNKGYFDFNRSNQNKKWFDESIQEHLGSLFSTDTRIMEKHKLLELAIMEGKKSPFQAADELFTLFLQQLKNK